jgi:hypothetical protein
MVWGMKPMIIIILARSYSYSSSFSIIWRQPNTIPEFYTYNEKKKRHGKSRTFMSLSSTISYAPVVEVACQQSPFGSVA